MKFCITGTLDGISKEDARNLIEENGHETVKSMSSVVDYLVQGKITKRDFPSNSLKIAKQFNKKIISLSELWEILENPDTPKSIPNDVIQRVRNNKTSGSPIEWQQIPVVERTQYRLEYFNANGEISERDVVIVETGEKSFEGRFPNIKYFRAIEISGNDIKKIFRCDRIIELKEID